MVRRNDRMSLTRFAYIFLMLSSIPSLLFGAITVTYTPASLAFEFRSNPSNSSRPLPYTSDAIIGIKLGTLKVTGGPIYTPVWGNTNEVSSGTVTVEGSMLNGDNEATFYLMSVAYPDGESQPPTIKVFSGNFLPIISYDPVTVSANPFYVDLWVVNTAQTNPNTTSTTRPASDFILNTAYTLKDFNPRFSFVTANRSDRNANSMMQGNGNANSSHGSYTIVNGDAAGADNTPIVDPGAYTDDPLSPGVPYGNPAAVVIQTFFNLGSSEVLITLGEHTGSNVKEINSATLGVTVTNGNGTEKANLNITFTDNSPPDKSGFHLLHVDAPGPTIPYKLFWGENLQTLIEIEEGTPIPWENLAAGNHTNKLYMGEIDAETVDQAASGTYKSTVSVTIANN